MNRDYYAGITEGRMKEREHIIKLLEKRRDDLLGCHKNDDCHVRADAVDVVIDDILFEFGDEKARGRNTMVDKQPKI